MESSDAREKQGSIFPPTRWSLIASVQSQSEESSTKALGELCEAYWKPLYVFARRSGNSPERAEDLVQGFFERLIARNSIDSVHREKGKLRSFFLASFKKYVAGEWRRDTAIKRGGGSTPLSIEAEAAEEQYQNEPRERMTPEQLFDRRWALTVLDGVMAKLEASFTERNQAERFAILKNYLEPASSEAKYVEAAEKLSLSENAIQQAVFRMRAKYREILEQEIADTIEDRAGVQEELRHLIAALAAH